MALKTLLISIFTIMSFHGYADDYREGYYIEQQDTLRGFIKIDKQLKNVKFKESLALPYHKTLEPNAISGFTIENTEIFIAFKPSNSHHPIFIQMMIKGYTTLYRGYSEDNVVFFVQKKGEDIRKIHRKYAKQFLNAYFSDCDELKKIFSSNKKLPYSTGKMITLVSTYNRCQNPNALQ